MKKHMKHRKYSGIQVEPDIAGMINKMQEQLVSLERKVDTLIGGSSQKPAEVKPFPKPFQQHGQIHSHGLVRQDNSYRERTLHKAICADCNKECEVPFAPSGGRPVYCKVCFSKRKSGSPEGRPAASYRGGGNPPQERYDNGPREAPRLGSTSLTTSRSGQANPPQAAHADRPHGGEKKRFGEHKRPAAKRRKPRA